MAYQPVPNTAQVKLIGQIDGQQTINDLYFHNPGGTISTVQLQNLGNVVGSWYVADVAIHLAEAWSFLRAVVTDLTTQTSGQVQVNYTGVSGGVAGEPAPNNVSYAISFRAASRGRNYRGRNYIPAIPNSDVDVNTISDTFANDMVSAYDALEPGGAFDPTPFEWVVVSRVLAGVLRPSGLPSAIVNVSVTDLIVDSQRRRLPGRGK